MFGLADNYPRELFILPANVGGNFRIGLHTRDNGVLVWYVLHNRSIEGVPDTARHVMELTELDAGKWLRLGSDRP